jgi:hypothetical protein
MNFRTSGIEMYDGSTNPVEWLEVYRLTIEAARGDSYVVANHLPFCLSSFARTWLLGLLVGSVCSWNHLCQLLLAFLSYRIIYKRTNASCRFHPGVF